eukprot:2444539-Lingulodinium_polyedra.AAC.1
MPSNQDEPFSQDSRMGLHPLVVASVEASTQLEAELEALEPAKKKLMMLGLEGLLEKAVTRVKEKSGIGWDARIHTIFDNVDQRVDQRLKASEE